MPIDFYEVLGVGRDANDDEIKKAYRRLARQYHPDTNDGDPASEARFKEISVAYETLRDPERRRRYDMFGPEGVRGSGAAGGDPFAGFGAGLGDIFDAFFGAGTGRTRTGPIRGNDLEVQLELHFEEAVFGAQREVQLRTPSMCSTCDGTGAKAGTSPTVCGQCGGSGELQPCWVPRAVRQRCDCSPLSSPTWYCSPRTCPIQQGWTSCVRFARSRTYRS